MAFSSVGYESHDDHIQLILHILLCSRLIFPINMKTWILNLVFTTFNDYKRVIL